MIEDSYTLPIEGLTPTTVWDDLRIEPIARTTGSNAPTFEKWFDNGAGSRGVYLYSFDNAAGGSEKEVFFTMQMPHGWAGTVLHLHVHWVAEGTAALSKVRWGVEYTFTDIGETFPNTVLSYADTDMANATGTTGTTAKKHTLTEFTDITPSATQNGISAILIGRLFRDSNNVADTYTGKAGLLYIDAHFELDAAGSGQEFVK